MEAVKLMILTRILSNTLIIRLIPSIYFIFGRKNKKETQNKNQEKEERRLLCRFVLDGKGKEIGESVAIDEDVVIVKSGNNYLGVPLKHIEKKEDTLLVKGLVNREQAEKMGEEWRKKSFKKIDHPEGNADEL